MKLPKTIRILGYTYTIYRFDDGDLQSGFHDAKRLLIGLHVDLLPQSEQVTILHEVLEAISLQLHLNLSEEQIHAISQGYFQVMQDNPGLFDLKGKP